MHRTDVTGVTSSVRSLASTLVILTLMACSRSDSPVPADTDRATESGGERLLTEERLATLAAWADTAHARTGRLPPTLEALAPPDSGDPAYVPRERFLRDGWDRRIIYRITAARYELRSLGEDGIEGTPDDVVRLQSASPPQSPSR